MRRVSMADVAAAAGVSGQTVSRVVNASPRVDPATRARVEAAMSRLGYRPHRAARALRTGRTQTIGLVVATLDTVGNSRMLQAVAAAAAGRGYGVALVTAVGPESADDAFARLADQGVDGVVVLNEASPFAAAVPAAAGFRLLLVDAPGDPASPDAAPEFHVVQTDHAAGAHQAVAHLLELGHRRIAHIAGPADSFAAGQREEGWRSALTAAGLEVPAPVRGDWSAASGYAAGGRLDDATAVFVANDQMALGALRALADAGKTVPADVSVVGFDDIADAAEYRPPLTTVRQDFDALGARAVEVLLEDVESAADTAPVVETFTPALVVRASTAPRR